MYSNLASLRQAWDSFVEMQVAVINCVSEPLKVLRNGRLQVEAQGVASVVHAMELNREAEMDSVLEHVRGQVRD
jgi:hypothetical protein